jgi:hypothetical protein
MIDNILGSILNKLLNIKFFVIVFFLVASVYGHMTGNFEKAGAIIS